MLIGDEELKFLGGHPSYFKYLSLYILQDNLSCWMVHGQCDRLRRYQSTCLGCFFLLFGSTQYLIGERLFLQCNRIVLRLFHASFAITQEYIVNEGNSVLTGTERDKK